MLPKYNSGCANKVSLDQYFSKVKPSIQAVLQKSKKGEISLYEQNDVRFEYNIQSAVFVLCFDSILMIDFDFKFGFDEEKIYRLIRTYTDFMHSNGYDMLFQVYRTDRGVHAFLINRYSYFTSEESLQIMMDMCSDTDYIAFSQVRGFCVRVSPKIKMHTEDTIANEFVAKGDNFRIGYGRPYKDIVNVLSVHLKLIKWFNKRFQESFSDLKKVEYIPELDIVDVIVPNYLLDQARDVFIKLLIDNNLKNEEQEFLRPPEYHGEKARSEFILQAYKDDHVTVFYDIYRGIWAMCTEDILMVDFDQTRKESKEQFLKSIQQYTESMHKNGTDYCFDIYETDRGLHAFLVNKYVFHDMKETREILQALTPDNNEHIKFVESRSHCVRISPKVYNSNNSVKTQAQITSEFVTRNCYNGVCRVGYGQPLSNIVNVLKTHVRITDIIKDLYLNSFDEIASVTINNKRTLYIPTDETVDKIGWIFTKVLDSYSLFKPRTDTMGKKQRLKLVESERYKDIIPSNVELACGRTSINERIKWTGTSNPKFTDDVPFRGLDEYVKNVASKIIANKCGSQLIDLRGPRYPFVLGFDRRMELSWMLFYDLLTLDWDDIPKENAVEILRRFLNYESRLPREERSTNSEMCFKLYETDNGVHAFLVSHRIPFYDDKSSRIMLETCGDFAYAGFSKAYGYSLRLSPKVYQKDGKNRKSRGEIKDQFIQKLGVNGIVYVGDTTNIDPYLDFLTDMLYNAQKYILSLWTESNYNVNPEDLTEDIRDFVITEYRKLDNVELWPDNIRWSEGILTCPYTVPVIPSQFS